MQFPTREPMARVLDRFDRNTQAARAALVTTTDVQFAKPWLFKVGGRVVSRDTKFTVYRRTILNHLVHHRGQLTVSLPLDDALVPSIDGPTTDEPGS